MELLAIAMCNLASGVSQGLPPGIEGEDPTYPTVAEAAAALLRR